MILYGWAESDYLFGYRILNEPVTQRPDPDIGLKLPDIRRKLIFFLFFNEIGHSIVFESFYRSEISQKCINLLAFKKQNQIEALQ